MSIFYLNRENKNKGLGNEIANWIEEAETDGLCTITKNDSVSLKAKAIPRKSFLVHMGAIIFDVKEICLVSEDYKAETREMNYMFLDNSGIDLKRLVVDDGDISIEMGAR